MNPSIMKMQILKVKDAGDIENERVILKINADCNIGWYLLFDNTYESDGSPSNLWRHMFIFPDKEVKKGDFVWLYTKEGKNRDRSNESKTTTHELYWGLGNTIWNNGVAHDSVHLVKYEDSQSFRI